MEVVLDSKGGGILNLLFFFLSFFFHGFRTKVEIAVDGFSIRIRSQKKGRGKKRGWGGKRL